MWQYDNTTNFRLDRKWKLLLIPGLVIQWFLFMFPSGRYSSIVSATRQSHSPLMTWFYSAAFYIAILLLIVYSITPHTQGQ